MDRGIVSVFWALVAVFVMLVLSFVAATALGYAAGVVIMSLAVVFLVLGIVLCVVAARSKLDAALKRFLLLTGGSAAGIMISVVLHNVISGLFADYWESSGVGDEPFFFIMGIIVLPIAFVVGVFGSIALMARDKK